MNRIICVFTALCLFVAPLNIALAKQEDPKPLITDIRKGARAPYTGVLLNPAASAKVFVAKDYSEKSCQLRIEYEVQKEIAKLNLIIKSQQASYDALEQKYKTIVSLKDKEIERLSEIATGKKDYTTWWAVGGLLVGIGLTLAVVFAVDAGRNSL